MLLERLAAAAAALFLLLHFFPRRARGAVVALALEHGAASE